MIKNLLNTVVKKLIKKKLKITLAESCTGGLLASSITSINGSSKIFNLGLITYSNKAKIDILNVPKKIIEKYGSVSDECCVSMVRNLSKISKADISISITGIAGPNGGTTLKPVGLVFIAIKNRNKISLNKCQFKNRGRIFIQKASVKKSLSLILRSIQ